MIIELRGVEFVNKGAELMLHAIVDKIKGAFPDAQFVMEHTARAPRSKQKSQGILTKTYFEVKRRRIRYTVNVSSSLNYLPFAFRNKLSYASSEDIDVVLDGSGFAFGDEWGAEKAGYRVADHIISWKQQGKKVVLLPQAFGPFENVQLQKKMKLIITHADLIFARDKKSLAYLEKLDDKAENIFLRPDFTNLIKGKLPQDFDSKLNQIALIPNQKMIATSNEPDVEEQYLKLFSKAIHLLQSKNEKPFFLIHESQMDLAIANKINSTLSQAIPIVKEEDPLFVKGIIGSCRAVITSRFHGLVSCLSQNIPCLSTSWSHKYKMLLEEYDYQEGLLEMHVTADLLSEKIDQILQEGSRHTITKKLKLNANLQKQRSEQMWSQVFKLLEEIE